MNDYHNETTDRISTNEDKQFRIHKEIHIGYRHRKSRRLVRESSKPLRMLN